MSDSELAAELKATFLFEACTDDQVEWAVEHSRLERRAARDLLFAEADIPDAFWVLLEGEFQLSRTLDGREMDFHSSSEPGSWVGWLPNFEISPVLLNARVLRESRLLRFSIEAIRHMIANGFPVIGHLLSGLMSGARTIEATTLQQQKLAAVGRLSAALAHELNNPAAAASRAAGDLRSALKTRDQRGLVLVRGLNADQFGHLLELVQVVRERERVSLGPLDRGDREDELATWLESHGVADAYQLGASLVDVAVTLGDLEAVAAIIPLELLADSIAWLDAAMSAEELARTIEVSAARISTLVTAMKEFTYLDRDGLQEIDLNRGIDNTLLILNHKLKMGVEVIRDFDTALPKVCAYGSELNQVWTNLIDNAAYAMGGKGELRISTRQVGEHVLVEIADNGPGIPAEIRDRIFEPFFTTKGVGAGSGLGLDIVRRIMWRHNGDITVDSAPGDTRFRVRLPIDQKQGTA